MTAPLLLDGDAPAASVELRFRTIFDAELAYVCRSLRRLGVAERDVDDLAQEVFVNVHQHLHRYDESRSLRAWLFAFARNAAANYRRLARHRTETALDADGEAATPATSVESRDLVLRALDVLDDDKKHVLILHDIDGCSAPEIAASLTVPLNTVYSRLRLARAAFEAAVAELDGVT